MALNINITFVGVVLSPFCSYFLCLVTRRECRIANVNARTVFPVGEPASPVWQRVP